VNGEILYITRSSSGCFAASAAALVASDRIGDFDGMEEETVGSSVRYYSLGRRKFALCARGAAVSHTGFGFPLLMCTTSLSIRSEGTSQWVVVKPH
jgi:hypothetical protein